MWILLAIAILVVLGTVYLGVRQAHHPAPPGRHVDGDVQAEQRGRFRGWGGYG